MTEREPLCQITGFHAKPHSGKCPECGDALDLARAVLAVTAPSEPREAYMADVRAHIADLEARCDRLRTALERSCDAHDASARARSEDDDRDAGNEVDAAFAHARAVLAVTAPSGPRMTVAQLDELDELDAAERARGGK